MSPFDALLHVGKYHSEHPRRARRKVYEMRNLRADSKMEFRKFILGLTGRSYGG